MALELHDVRDAEQFARAVATRSKLNLSYHDDADLREYLLAELWILSTRYDPGAGTVSFSTWAGRILRLRCTDWVRQRHGRTKWQFAGHTYERPRPELVPLDAFDDEPCSELGRAQPGGSVGDDEHWLADELRSLDARGRRPPGRDGGLG